MSSYSGETVAGRVGGSGDLFDELEWCTFCF